MVHSFLCYIRSKNVLADPQKIKASDTPFKFWYKYKMRRSAITPSYFTGKKGNNINEICGQGNTSKQS